VSTWNIRHGSKVYKWKAELEKGVGQPNVVGRITIYGVVLARMDSLFSIYTKKKCVPECVRITKEGKMWSVVSWQNITI
jgi:hypothetical protein